ncbi:hypothetical protein FGO68_gene4701 [Halteria grandinella]|uniref:Uncharacterized protein n=1 Tax=Halteria grandinella TaxID=5974 RepID=A0A8J8T102_HALGN|nr:hypothetical protein FGO68_gene4701 [Halteria grandinella]
MRKQNNIWLCLVFCCSIDISPLLFVLGILFSSSSLQTFSQRSESMVIEQKQDTLQCQIYLPFHEINTYFLDIFRNFWGALVILYVFDKVQNQPKPEKAPLRVLTTNLEDSQKSMSIFQTAKKALRRQSLSLLIFRQTNYS